MDEEIKEPNFLKSSIDFKKMTVMTFFDAIERMKKGEIEGVTIGSKTALRVITNFGLIEGKAVFLDASGKQSAPVDTLYFALLQGADILMSDLEADITPENLRTINQTGRLLLKDVIITPFSSPQNKFSLERLLIFTDQIVGITFGVEGQQ